MKILPNFCLLFFFLITFNQIAFSCQCDEYGVPPCAQFDRANGVFIGKVTKIDPPKDPDDIFRTSIIHFDVEQAFKGVSQTKVKGEYEFGTSCASKDDFQVGKRYVIFGFRGSEDQPFSIPHCVPSPEYSPDSDVVKFLNNFSQGKSKEYITGRLITNGHKEIDATVTVSKDGKNYTTKTDYYGYFDIEVNESGNYQVRVNVPYSSKVFSFSSIPFKTLSVKETETIVEYEAIVKKGLCDHQQFTFDEVDLKATSSISGRIINYKRNQTPNLYVYLARSEILEKDAIKREKLESVRVDENGNFKFEKLREGRYLILANPYNFPDQNMPFLRTYLPGVSNFMDAMIIELGQDRELTGLEFKLPSGLPLRKIEGQVFWSDGTPATTAFKNLQNDLPPWVSIYKSNGDSLIFFESPKFAENGKFSLTVYDGFTYLISASAQNSNNKFLHGLVKIKADKNLKPFKIILNREGTVDTEKFLKESEEKH